MFLNRHRRNTPADRITTLNIRNVRASRLIFPFSLVASQSDLLSFGRRSRPSSSRFKALKKCVKPRTSIYVWCIAKEYKLLCVYSIECGCRINNCIPDVIKVELALASRLSSYRKITYFHLSVSIFRKALCLRSKVVSVLLISLIKVDPVCLSTQMTEIQMLIIFEKGYMMGSR